MTDSSQKFDYVEEELYVFFPIINPTNEEKIGEEKALTQESLTHILNTLPSAQRTWRDTSIQDRGLFVKKIAQTLLADKKEWAYLMATTMGKPIAQGEQEIEKVALLCDYYQREAPRMLESRNVSMGEDEATISYGPQGTVFGIMPWNFPVWQVLRWAIPALMSGNTVLLKHAENVFNIAIKLETLFTQVGVPQYVFKNLVLLTEQVEQVIAHPFVRVVSFTGSARAGKIIAGLSGSYLKKNILELGGTDPALVLEDAPLDLTVQTIVRSRLANTGQSCIATKRVIADAQIYPLLVEKLKEELSSVKYGDPTDETNLLGPLARKDLRDHLHQQVKDLISKGAQLLLGGDLPKGEGYFYPPTLLSFEEVDFGQKKEHRYSTDQELFGPVLVLYKAEDESQMIKMANDSSYGLGSSLFTKRSDRGFTLSKKLNFGATFVNSLVRSIPELPFGGVRESGYGRELGEEGVKEFVNIKTTYCHKHS